MYSSLSANSFSCRTKRSQNWCCQTGPVVPRWRLMRRADIHFTSWIAREIARGCSTTYECMPVVRHEHVTAQSEAQLLSRFFHGRENQRELVFRQDREIAAQVDRYEED